jgi:UDP-GlcNAc:undecaprenyl-phosphate/decaprenyl-phosphate GlcNAc-1-phosphate transferase
MAFNYLIIIIFSFLFFSLSEKISRIFSFIDYPNKRRSHAVPTANMGGLGIMLVIVITKYITSIPSLDFTNIIIYSCVAGIVGLADDKFQFSPFKKTFLLSFPILILIYKNVYVSNIGSYQGVGLINLGPYAEIFTFLCCYTLINAFNYSDGLDGQANTLFISSMLLIFFLIIYFITESAERIKVIEFIKLLITSLLIYFLYNYKLLRLPKLFMGNSGSLCLGFFLSFFIIYVFKLGVHPALLIWCVNIIVFDFFSTNIIRFLNKKGILEPSLDHFHHQLQYFLKLSPILINIFSFALNSIVGMVGFLIFYFISPMVSLISFMIFFLIFYFVKKNYLIFR